MKSLIKTFLSVFLGLLFACGGGSEKNTIPPGPVKPLIPPSVLDIDVPGLPSLNLMATDSSILYRFDANQLKATSGYDVARFNEVTGVAPGPGNTLYVVNGRGIGQLLRINLDTRTPEYIGAVNMIGGDLAYDAVNSILYMVSANALFKLDTNTGLAQMVGQTGYNRLSGLAYSPSLGLIAVNLQGQLLSLNTTTGSGQLIGDTGIADLTGLAIDGNNVLYATGRSPAQLFRINTGNADATAIRPLNNSIALAHHNGTLYSFNRSQLSRIQVDMADKVAYTGIDDVSGTAYDSANGILYGITPNGFLISLDTTTGQGSILSKLSIRKATSLAFDEVEKVLYTTTYSTNSNRKLYKIIPTTFKSILIGELQQQFVATAMGQGQLYGLNNSGHYHQISTADATSIEILRNLGGNALAYNNGAIYVSGGNTVRMITPGTGVVQATITMDNPLGGNLAYGNTLFSVRKVTTGQELADVSITGVSPDLSGTVNTKGDLGLNSIQRIFMGRNDSLYGVNSLQQIVSLDKGTGAQQLVADTNGSRFNSYSYLPGSDLVYAISPGSNQLYTINIHPSINTGEVVLKTNLDTYIQSIAFHPDTSVLYGYEASKLRLVTIDTETGSVTPVGTTGVSNIEALSFNSSGQLFGRARNLYQYEINPNDGSLISTRRMQLGFNQSNLAIDATNTKFGLVADELLHVNGGEDEWLSGVGMFGATLAYDNSRDTSFGISNEGIMVEVDMDTNQTLRLLGPAPTGIDGLAIHPGNGVVYGTFQSYNSTSLVTLNLENGAMNLVGDLSNNRLSTITFDSGGTLYGLNYDGDVFSISLTDASPTLVAAAADTGFARGQGLSYLDVGDAGTLYSLVSNGNAQDLVAVDLSSKQGSVVGSMPVHTGMQSLTSRFSDNTLFGNYDHSGILFKIDHTIPEARRIRALTYYSWSMAYDPGRDVIYDMSQDFLQEVNPLTGDTKFIGYLVPRNTRVALAFDHVRNILYGATQDELFTIDTGTGVMTTLGTFANQERVYGMTFDPANNQLFVTTPNLGKIDLAAISTQAPISLPTVIPIGNATSSSVLAYDYDNHILYGLGEDSLVEIDITDGTISNTIATGIGLQDLIYTGM